MNKFPAFLLVLPITQSVFAEMTCDTNVSKYHATYTPNSYTCNVGQYLPANSLGCVVCPNGFTCPGGTFNFNPNLFQGLIFETIPQTTMNNICAANFPTKLKAKYAPNSHDCSSGYYLPANIDECTLCPSGNACVGGTYSFNETLAQGIQNCANGTFAPSGSAVCYPHILHVGDSNVYLKSTKQTTPSLNIKIGNDVFYANMTTERTRMNKDSSRYFRARWGNNDYYICDDTTCTGE